MIARVFNPRVLEREQKSIILVQIGHNCSIGKNCIIVSFVGISGSTTIEDNCILAGQAGFAGHITVGKGAIVAGKSGVISDVQQREK